MLLLQTKEQWKSSCTILVDNPLKLDKLNEIYDRPAYDVRYYVKCIPGNLNVNGSTLSKANHSCTAARFGDSGAWISIFHLHDLIERQQYLVNKDTTISVYESTKLQI